MDLSEYEVFRGAVDGHIETLRHVGGCFPERVQKLISDAIGLAECEADLLESGIPNSLWVFFISVLGDASKLTQADKKGWPDLPLGAAKRPLDFESFFQGIEGHVAGDEGQGKD